LKYWNLTTDDISEALEKCKMKENEIDGAANAVGAFMRRGYHN